jgi:hypothetical protein
MIYKLLKKLIVSPREGWNELRDLETSLNQTYFSVLLPLVFFASTITFIGTALSNEVSIEIALNYFGFTFLKWISSIILSSWAISKLVGGFKGVRDYNTILILVTVSSSLLVIFTSLSHLFPAIRMVFSGLSFIGLIYYYFGLVELSGIIKERIIGFLLISLLVFAINVFVFEFFWGLIFNIPIYL